MQPCFVLQCRSASTVGGSLGHLAGRSFRPGLKWYQGLWGDKGRLCGVRGVSASGHAGVCILPVDGCHVLA